jgi:hypothetical protein
MAYSCRQGRLEKQDAVVCDLIIPLYCMGILEIAWRPSSGVVYVYSRCLFKVPYVAHIARRG